MEWLSERGWINGEGDVTERSSPVHFGVNPFPGWIWDCWGGTEMESASCISYSSRQHIYIKKHQLIIMCICRLLFCKLHQKHMLKTTTNTHTHKPLLPAVCDLRWCLAIISFSTVFSAVIMCARLCSVVFGMRKYTSSPQPLQVFVEPSGVATRFLKRGHDS